MKTAVRRIVSVGILLILLFAMQRLVMPKYVDDVIEGGFTAEYYREENPHEVLMIGDCELYENFSPITMWKNYGITSYIRGSAQQLTWQSYYLLEDALKYETPDVVVFNVLELKYNEPQREEYNRMTLDGMRWSVSKVQAIRASMLPEEHFIDYVFPLLRYHSRVTGLTANDWKYYFKDKTRTTAGYYMRVDTAPYEEGIWEEEEPESETLVEEVIQTAEQRRILHFCMEQLKSDYREALYLVYFEGMSHAEAAYLMGKAEKQIADLVYRGRKALKKKLEKEGITDAKS